MPPSISSGAFIYLFFLVQRGRILVKMEKSNSHCKMPATAYTFFSFLSEAPSARLDSIPHSTLVRSVPFLPCRVSPGNKRVFQGHCVCAGCCGVGGVCRYTIEETEDKGVLRSDVVAAASVRSDKGNCGGEEQGASFGGLAVLPLFAAS